MCAARSNKRASTPIRSRGSKTPRPGKSALPDCRTRRRRGTSSSTTTRCVASSRLRLPARSAAWLARRRAGDDRGEAIPSGAPAVRGFARPPGNADDHVAEVRQGRRQTPPAREKMNATACADKRFAGETVEGGCGGPRAGRGAAHAQQWFALGRGPKRALSLSDYREVVAAIGEDPDIVTAYCLWHSNITRMLLKNIPVRLIASLHNTSIHQIEKNYSRHITEHSSRRLRRAAGYCRSPRPAPPMSSRWRSDKPWPASPSG